MEQWRNLVKINRNFRKSVNLQLDLGDEERVLSYIPTRSSAVILRRYLEAASGNGTEGATILIGPYGKGKSHLLLVLLTLLHGTLPEKLKEKIAAIEPDLAEIMEIFNTEDKKYLPVLISASQGTELNQSFLGALQEALKREGLGELAPETYFSKALEVLENWKKDYPGVYELFGASLEAAGEKESTFIHKLERQEKEALELFCGIYPRLTAGSVFMPILQSEALKIYQQVNRILTEEYGYSGMFLVFDEFSKYIEGHENSGFAGDMKVLQDMCELANQSEGKLFLTMVAHKSIHEYTRSIDASVKNAFRGVEGRISEIPFVVSAQNNYELIADTIEKREPEFSEVFQDLCSRGELAEEMESSFPLPCFSGLFTKEEFEKTVGKGCFPLTPLGAYALLHISEKVAQNERTIFTFLADEGQGCLPWLLQKYPEKRVGADKIYDYFKGLFRETEDLPQIHNEWLKAEYALSRTKNETESIIVKTVAVIRMINREDEFPAKDREIRLAAGLTETDYRQAMERLKEEDVLVYRSNAGVYAFRSNVGVDVEKKIADKMAELRSRISYCEILERVCEMDFELPKQYNRQYAITRYFQYEYMTPELFFALEHGDYLFKEKFSDGKMIVLVSETPVEKEQVRQQLERLGDIRIIALVSDRGFSLGELLLKYEAVRALKCDSKFIEENVLLLQELELCEEDIAFEINARMEADFLAENGNATVLRVGRKPQKYGTSAAFNSMLSEICSQYYGASPKVNHELLNVQHIGSQYLRARNGVVKNLLEGKDCTHYEKGTTPEAMVYRAAFYHTAGDKGCEELSREIELFFARCAGEKQTFDKLYEKLQGEHIGARKGIIPLFLAKKLADAEGTAVVYIGGKELEISADTLNHVNDFPGKYSLYLEPETAEKENYIKALEELFDVAGSYALSKQSRLVKIVESMQKWYRSLPQYAMVTLDFSEEEIAGMRDRIFGLEVKAADFEKEQVIKNINTLRNLLRRAEVNPRELIFDKIPACFGESSYEETAKYLSAVKMLLSGKIQILVEKVTRAVKQEFRVSEEANLKACLMEWYGLQREKVKSHVFSSTIHSFLNYIEQLTTNDEGEIAARLSRILLDIYLEDWTDETLEGFREELHAIRSEVEKAAEQKGTMGGTSRIILRDAAGNELEKSYAADISDSTSRYLSNMIGEALEEFGDTLEMGQKVAVLVQAIEGLLQK